jgi:hypothetical protein
MAHRFRQFFSRSPSLSHHSPVTARTTRVTTTPPSLHEIPGAAIILSSSPRDPRQSRARLLKATRRNATVTFGLSRNWGAPVGERYPATTSVLEWKPQLGGSSR